MDATIRRSGHFAFVLLLLAFSAVACKTAQGGGIKQAEAINSGLDDASEDLDDAEEETDNSDATPEQKEKIKAKIRSGKTKIESQKPAVAELGKKSDTNFQISEEQKEDIAELKVYRTIVWVASAAIGLGIIALVVYFIRRRASRA